MAAMPHKAGIAIHIEPHRPIELSYLLSGLKGIGDEYQHYSKAKLGGTGKNSSKLYVGSVKPGSIDIFLQPELIEIAKGSLAVASAAGPVDAANALLDFGNQLKSLLDLFKNKPNPKDVSISQCDNAINITKNVVEAGGTQTITHINVEGDFQPIYQMDANDASKIMKQANEMKALLKLPAAERVNSVALVWKTFDKSPARTEGDRSPDKGIIEEIDPVAKAILFGDDEAGLKSRILVDEENPMIMVYYVDIEVVRVAKKIKAYRIVGFHGKEPLDYED